MVVRASGSEGGLVTGGQRVRGRGGTVRTGTRTGLRWWNVYEDRASWERRHPAARVFARWVDEHLVRPHAELGRDGPVCPFVSHSATRRLVWAGLAPENDRSAESDVRRTIDDALEVHCALRGENPSEARGLTLVTMFPELTRFDLIDAVHRARKTEVVGQGLMLGQFYPGCAVPGLWNHDFRPLDAPVPMLVLRTMMSTDFPFLAARSDWLYAYLTRMAPNLPGKLRWAIAERMRVDGPAAAEITALRAHAPGEHAR
ncbi:DUF6875 domain-containing protein [Nocardia sp. BMG51109]|uniref:DUF6875 domain-containing protein n=1 Tax=Nocardia sp. BMG51109 TaxID=1056816 RepID=UPI0004635163|nr:hypothetical protein [Nocardia sp. BMG51109]